MQLSTSQSMYLWTLLLLLSTPDGPGASRWFVESVRRTHLQIRTRLLGVGRRRLAIFNHRYF
jgi:hypothetical protein